MNLDYEINQEHTTLTVNSIDSWKLDDTISGDFVVSIAKKSDMEVEEIFKRKYPIQYMQARLRFYKKLRKLLKANEELM